MWVVKFWDRKALEYSYKYESRYFKIRNKKHPHFSAKHDAKDWFRKTCIRSQ